MRTSLVLLSVLAAAASDRSPAHAQAWLPDRNYTEGPGIRVGDLELHPGVTVRGGYDNNVYRADGKFQPREGSAILAVTPHLNITTLGTQRKTQGEDRADASSMLPTIQFRSGLSATYFQYFINNGPRNLAVDSDFALQVLPRRPVNFEVSAAYVRSVPPFTQRATGTNRKTFIYDSISPIARVNVGSRSQVLTSYVAYAPRVFIYESSTFNYLNNVQHGIQAGASWRFLPSTALVYDADLSLQQYQKSLNKTDSPVVLSNSKRFRTRVGLNGALTNRVNFRLMAGYAAGFYDNRAIDEYEAPIGEAGVTYKFGPGGTAAFSFGYQRDVQSSALGGWIRLDRGYFSLGSMIGRAFMLSMEGGAAYVGYGHLIGRSATPGDNPYVGLGVNGGTSRNDVRLDGAVHGEYRATNWLAFTGDFQVQAIVTNFEYNNSLNGVALPDPARYYSVAAFGGVRAHY